MNNSVGTFQEAPVQRKWNVVIGFNLALGILLWFFFLTDYSLTGVVADVFFPPAVAFVALITLFLTRRALSISTKLLSTICCLPSLIGGGLYVSVAIVIIFVPPFNSFGSLMAQEVEGETRIQWVASPDGSQAAEVYFRPVGAYTRANGRIYIRLKRRWLPFVERDVYYVPATYKATKYTEDYMIWRDNDTLYIPEMQREIKIGVIKFEAPSVVTYPMWFLQFLFDNQNQKEDPELAELVRSVPVYPGTITDDQLGFSKDLNTSFRSFLTSKQHPDQVAKWYLDALSQSPWSIGLVERYVDYYESGTLIRHCIQIRQDEGDGAKRVYYLEIVGLNEATSPVRVNIGTPNPATLTCQR